MFIAPDAVEQKLAGKNMLMSLGDAARAVGLAPAYLDPKDWRRLAAIIAGLGFRQRLVDGIHVWLRVKPKATPKPQPELFPLVTDGPGEGAQRSATPPAPNIVGWPPAQRGRAI